MKYSIAIIKDMARRIGTPIIYFWGHHPGANKITATCMSQWYECRFVMDGVQYHTAEQYMMAAKARLFGDDMAWQAIMEASTPQEYKKWGRKVKNFDSATWNAHKFGIVVAGNIAKFSQNPHLKSFLLSTGNAILAEASPYDAVWGIGMDIKQAEKAGPEAWQGENLLGLALMEVRDMLKEKEDGLCS